MSRDRNPMNELEYNCRGAQELIGPQAQVFSLLLMRLEDVEAGRVQ